MLYTYELGDQRITRRKFGQAGFADHCRRARGKCADALILSFVCHTSHRTQGLVCGAQDFLGVFRVRANAWRGLLRV